VRESDGQECPSSSKVESTDKNVRPPEKGGLTDKTVRPPEMGVDGQECPSSRDGMIDGQECPSSKATTSLAVGASRLAAQQSYLTIND